MTINIQNFNVVNQQNLNALKDNNITTLINHINTLNSQQQVDELFNCLSQTLALKGRKQYTGTCESIIKSNIYRFAKLHSPEAINATQNDQFKEDSNLSDTIAKVIYLTKHRFTSDSAHWYLWNTRFTHHMDKLLGRSDNLTSTRAMAYLIPGLSLATLGLMQLFPPTADEPIPNNRSLVVGVPPLATGSLLIISPIVHAVRASGEDNP